MISSTPVAERGLPASLRRSSFSFTAARLAAVTVVVAAAVLSACGGPAGPETPPESSPDAAATIGEVDGSVAADPAASPAGGAAHVPELTEIGGQELEVVSYPVSEALEAEGGAPVRAMLERLGVAPADVRLVLAIAPGDDLAVSRWRLPEADAGSILSSWEAAADDSWSEDELAGVPALVGRGPDDARAWVVARDGCFVYVRTDDRGLAEEVAAAVRSCG